MSNESFLTLVKESILNTAPNSRVLYSPDLDNNPEVDRSFTFLILVDDPEIDFRKEREITDPLYDLELKSGIALSLKVIPKHKWDEVLKGSQFYNEMESNGYRLL